MLSTALQNEGPKSTGMAHSSEHNRSISRNGKYENEMNRTNACKRKQHLSEDLSGGRRFNIVGLDKHGSVTNCKELGKKVLKQPACVTDDGPVLSQWRKMVRCEKNTEMNSTSVSSGGDVRDGSGNIASRPSRKPILWEVDQDLLDAFDGDPELCLKAICALYRQHRAIALAEYLIYEDPEGRMKKSVAELDEVGPVAVEKCINIAKQHYKQVFEIYKKKEDPFFLS